MSILKAEDFKPDNSGFYSKSLYKWLKRNPHYNKIYMATWNNVDGHNPDRPIMMIGFKDDDGWFMGKNLKRLCSGSKVNYQAWAFGCVGHHVDEWEDVTERFIENYKKKGRCAIHGDYAHNLELVGRNLKRCTFCEAEYEKKSKRVTQHYWE